MKELKYIVRPMLEDFPVGNEEEISHQELMQWVQDHNYCRHHPDAWFKLASSDGTELNIEDYYEEAEQFFKANPELYK